MPKAAAPAALRKSGEKVPSAPINFTVLRPSTSFDAEVMNPPVVVNTG